MLGVCLSVAGMVFSVNFSIFSSEGVDNAREKGPIIQKACPQKDHFFV